MVFSVWWESETATTAEVTVLGKTDTATVTTEWARYYLSNDNPSGLYVTIMPGSSATIYLYMAQLELGDRPSDWRVAPEDTDADINNVQSTLSASIDVVSGQVTEQATAINNLTGRVSTAEEKITPEAIVNTVRTSTDYQNDLDTLSDAAAAAQSTADDAAAAAAANGQRITDQQTQITQNATAITQKADQTAVDSLGTRVTNAEAELTTQATQIAAKVSQTDFNSLEDRVEVAETVIQETPGGVEVIVSGTTKLKGVTTTNETTVEITDSEFNVSTDTINFAAGDGETFKLDNDGGSMQHLTVQDKLFAPNMAEKYVSPTTITVGAGGTYNSLQAVFDTLNNKVLVDEIEISLRSDCYEYATLCGVFGSGTIHITGNYTINGGLTINSCGVRIMLSPDIACPTGSISPALMITYCQSVTASAITMRGNGSGILVSVTASKLALYGCEFYNADYAIYAQENTDLCCVDLAGDINTASLMCSLSSIIWSGTRPSAGVYEVEPCLYKCNGSDPNDIETCPSDSGSGGTQPSPPSQVYEASLSATLTGSNYGTASWMSEQSMRQGVYGTTQYAGCMWFNTSTISGKTIKSAILTLKRVSGTGGSSAVNVNLYTITLTGKSGNPKTNATSYGSLGTISNGEIQDFSTSGLLSAVQALADGTAKGLMIYANDPNPTGNRQYSANYSKFDGTDGVVPVLTVSYQ